MGTVQGHAALKAVDRAKKLLMTKGHLLRYVSGTAVDETVVLGLSEILKNAGNAKKKDLVSQALSVLLKEHKNDWTVVYGFILADKEDNTSVSIETDSINVRNATANEMSVVSNASMQKGIMEYFLDPDVEILGQIWVATPCILPAATEDIDVITAINSWAATKGFFDPKHMRPRFFKWLESVRTIDEAIDELIKEAEQVKEAEPA